MTMADNSTPMKAVIQTKYGGPELMQLVTRPIPTMKANEMLVKIRATNVASGDWRVNTLSVPFLLKPIIRLIFGCTGPRSEIRGITAAGEVVNTGANVTLYQPGDRVYFINSSKAGCLAEYIALNESTVMAKIPQSMSFVEAAPVAFGAMSAYHFINPDNVKAGMEALVYGASGSVGSAAIQLAKYYGAKVTAISTEKNHKALLELGADHVIDYTKHDFRIDSSKQYDLIFDAVGKITKKSCASVLKSNGKYYSTWSPTDEKTERLEAINKIIDEGKLKTLIDKVYTLSEFEEAHTHTYSGHKCGNVVIETDK